MSEREGEIVVFISHLAMPISRRSRDATWANYLIEHCVKMIYFHSRRFFASFTLINGMFSSLPLAPLKMLRLNIFNIPPFRSHFFFDHEALIRASHTAAEFIECYTKKNQGMDTYVVLKLNVLLNEKKLSIPCNNVPPNLFAYLSLSLAFAYLLKRTQEMQKNIKGGMNWRNKFSIFVSANFTISSLFNIFGEQACLIISKLSKSYQKC